MELCSVGGFPARRLIAAQRPRGNAHLFPNVSVTTDDGKVLRLDSRTSLQLPFDLAGIDTYSLLILGAFAFNFL